MEWMKKEPNIKGSEQKRMTEEWKRKIISEKAQKWCKEERIKR